MSRIYVAGMGAVSPAGWGVPALCDTVAGQRPLPEQPLERPGWQEPLPAHRVPAPAPRPACLAHPRLRRVSAISQFAVAAAVEAMGSATGPVGIVFCTTSGSMNYSRRFYDEVLRDPATASPMLFPETVLNAPASHLSAVLQSSAVNYTLVGDSGAFLQGLALAAGWLEEERVPACLVVGAEEADWLTADVLRHFNRTTRLAEGAGAVLLRRGCPSPDVILLEGVTDSHPFMDHRTRVMAVQKMRAELPPQSKNELLCAGHVGNSRADAAESPAWRDWPGARLEVKSILGEGFAAAAAWQCIAAIEQLRQGRHAAAVISVPGAYQEAIGARFVAGSTIPPA